MTDPEPFSREILPDDFYEFLEVLYTHRVKYVIGGGYAVIYHGFPRTTGDLDIFFHPEPENTERLYQALKEFWGGNVPHIDSPDGLLDELGVQFGTPPNRIDLFNKLEGTAFSEAWKKRETIQLEEFEIYLLDREHLIAAKKASDRDRDRRDIRHLTNK